MKKTILLLLSLGLLMFLLFFTGCAGFGHALTAPFSGEGEWRDFGRDTKSLYTLDRGRGVMVADGNGGWREETPEESFQDSLNDGVINGSMSISEYNAFMESYYHLTPNPDGSPMFYLDRGRIKRVPPAPRLGEPSSLDRMEYERKALGLWGN